MSASGACVQNRLNNLFTCLRFLTDKRKIHLEPVRRYCIIKIRMEKTVGLADYTGSMQIILEYVTECWMKFPN